MSNWVRKSTEGRIQASKNKDPCLKAFYNLTVNAGLGKSCEKLEEQCNFHIVVNFIGILFSSIDLQFPS